MNISKKLQKIIALTSIICLSLGGLIGIGLLLNIFGENPSEAITCVLLTLLTIFVAGLLLLTSTEAIARKNKLGYISSSLILLSAFMMILQIWLAYLVPDFGETYIKIVLIISALSIFFSIVVNNYITLGKNLLVVQIIGYVTFIYFEFALVSTISFDLELVNIPFWIITIVWIVMFLILKIKSKEFKTNSSEMITITRQEYDDLKNKIKELEEMLNKGE